jgi:uncharacterized protein (TIGR02145 family)
LPLYSKINWSTSNESVVIVENGLITGIEKGFATISIEICGLIKHCTIEVSENSEDKVKVITTPITEIDCKTVIWGGNITSDEDVVISENGIYWSYSPNPELTGSKFVLGSGTGPFSSKVVLGYNMTYYLKAYAISNEGSIYYGNEISFINEVPEVADSDGNIYPIITIGTQTWMGENLRTTKYNDGEDIPFEDDEWWYNNYITELPAYRWYNDIEGYKYPFGALYNWYTVNTGKLCPSGWHVPSNVDWIILIDFIGDGIKLKEEGTRYWLDPNYPGTDEVCFRALPAGQWRNYAPAGEFDGIFQETIFWTSSQYPTSDNALYLELSKTGTFNMKYNWGRLCGYSVRCLKDN